MWDCQRNQLKHLTRIFAAGALATLLSACAAFSNRYDPVQLTAAQISNSHNGIVLLSSAAEHDCFWATYLYLMSDGSAYGQHIIALVPVDGYSQRSDFQDRFGFISALSLPPGRYYFSPGIANPSFVTAHSPRFDFTVGPGEVVYLGAYTQPGQCQIGAGGISDEWTRDHAMFATRNPNIDLSRATTRLMVFAGDAVTGEPALGAASPDKPGDKPTEASGNAETPTPTETAPPASP